jgi:hypothetical protein
MQCAAFFVAPLVLKAVLSVRPDRYYFHPSAPGWGRLGVWAVGKQGTSYSQKMTTNSVPTQIVGHSIALCGLEFAYAVLVNFYRPDS